MSRIGIFIFSGTGNTAIVADFIKEALAELGHQVMVEAMEDYTRNKTSPDLSGFDLVSFGHPVLGLGCTRIPTDFARLLPDSPGLKAFVFQCCGDPHPVNNNASRPLIRILRRKGMDVFHETQYAMAVNFIFKWPDDLVLQLYRAARSKSKAHARELMTGSRQALAMAWPLRGICRLVYFLEEELGARHFGLSLSAGKSCTACGACASQCPTGNIRLNNGRVQFGARCIFCMRCVYGCPMDAIRSRLFGFAIVKGYNGGFCISSVLNNAELKGAYLTDQSRGYYRHIWQYIRECEAERTDAGDALGGTEQ